MQTLEIKLDAIKDLDTELLKDVSGQVYKSVFMALDNGDCVTFLIHGYSHGEILKIALKLLDEFGGGLVSSDPNPSSLYI